MLTPTQRLAYEIARYEARESGRGLWSPEALQDYIPAAINLQRQHGRTYIEHLVRKAREVYYQYP